MKNNPVAKNAHKFNKSQVHKDRKKAEKKGERKHKGSYESVDEVLKVSDGVAAWIKDFQSSDAPQFAGKSAEKRKEMALAAYLDAKKGSKEESMNEKSKGLWHNIHQKRKRGEAPAKPGDKDYPKTLDIESKNTPGDGNPCWDTHKKVGTKMKNGKRVNDCVPKNEENIDELNKSTMKSYVGKALKSDKKERDAGGKTNRRHDGIMRAHQKLRKEENIDELSTKTLNNYRRKASKPNPKDSAAKQDKRYSGVARAGRKLDQRLESAQDRLDRMAKKHGLGKPNKAADDYMAKMRKKYGAKDDADLKRKMGMKESHEVTGKTFDEIRGRK